MADLSLFWFPVARECRSQAQAEREAKKKALLEVARGKATGEVRARVREGSGLPLHAVWSPLGNSSL